MQHNFTYSKALGTGADVQATSEYTPNDPFDLGEMYGVQNFYHKFVYNTYIVAQEPWFKGQNGLARTRGRWLGVRSHLHRRLRNAAELPPCGGWQGQAFGAADDVDYADNEQCVFTSPYKGGHSAHFGVAGESTGVGTATSVTPVNIVQGSVSGLAPGARDPSWASTTKNPGRGPDHGHAVLEHGWADQEGRPHHGVGDLRVLVHRDQHAEPPPVLSIRHGTCAVTPARWGVLNARPTASRDGVRRADHLLS